MLTDTRNSKYAKVNSLNMADVSWSKGFWADTVKACANSMVPQLQRMFESKDISHVLENFKICAGETTGDFDGTVFGDGDFYKWMEAEVYAACILKDKSRLDKLDEYIDLIARSQQEDGYISTKQIIEARQGKGGRLKDINEFEVYNMGHLFTSACIHKRLTGKDNFFNVARGAAKYLEKMYAEGEKNGDVQTAVCPSHYMGLIEMYRQTGEKQFLNLAQKAIELRDSVKNGMDDNQDRTPLKSHEKMIGHAVRGTYLYAGVADLYAEIGDEDYLLMMKKVWENLTSTKIYITGGIGALYNGCSPYGNFFVDQKIHQAFGYEYQLPNITAYNETCAAVGLVMWAYRMFLVEPEAKYFDIIERVMLNTNLAAVSLDGKKYFYENMLRRAKKLEYELIWPLTRSEYILSYCCPPNLARNIMQSSEYAYCINENSVYFGMYGASTAKIKLKNGADFTLVQETDYPYDGKIRLTASDINSNTGCNFMLRIPAWTENASLVVNGKEISINGKNGSYFKVYIADLTQMEILLDLGMEVRYTISHGMVEENTASAAVEYGPLVYCVESVDTEAEYLEDISLNVEASFDKEEMTLEGRKILALRTTGDLLCREGFDRNALYQPLRKVKREKLSIRFIPYFAWDNRDLGEMRIWFPYK